VKNRYEVCGAKTVIYVFYKGCEYKAIIDTEDLDLVKKFPNTWMTIFSDGRRTAYIYSRLYSEGRRKTVYLHRWILKGEYDLCIDHIDGNGLNNSRSNLRWCNHEQNAQNITAYRTNKSSGILGVTWDKQYKKWVGQIFPKGRRMFLGRFNNIEEAAEVVRMARVKYMPFSREARSANTGM
jgi:hypothetical protein